MGGSLGSVLGIQKSLGALPMDPWRVPCGHRMLPGHARSPPWSGAGGLRCRALQ